VDPGRDGVGTRPFAWASVREWPPKETLALCFDAGMRYFKAEPRHEEPGEPTLSYHEVDDSGWERRRVECFEDGRIVSADTVDEEAPVSLSLAPLPTVEELTAEGEFIVEVITRSEFEEVWARA
jgi:hypothetical protein